MKFYMADGLLRPTQADAKATGKPFNLVDVPTDKDGLMAYVNDLLGQIAALKVDGPEQATAMPAPQASTPAPPTPDLTAIKAKLVEQAKALQADAVEEKILDAGPAHLARFLSCSVSRLGELGRDGFLAYQALRGDADAAVGRRKMPIASSDERGLRYLVLSHIADLKGAGEACSPNATLVSSPDGARQDLGAESGPQGGD